MCDSSLRRSTRSRKQTPRYSETHLENVFSSGSEASANDRFQSRKNNRRKGKGIRDGDGDLNDINNDEEHVDAEAVDDDTSDDAVSPDDVSDDASSGLDETNAHDDTIDAMDVDVPNKSRIKLGTKRKRGTGKARSKGQQTSSNVTRKETEEAKKPQTSSSTVRTRGIITFHRHGSKAQKIRYMFGPDPIDVEAAIVVRDKWVRESCLPSRLPDDVTGSGGMSYSAHYSSAMRLEEMQRAWKWYTNGRGGEAFSRKQILEIMKGENVSRYTLTSEQLDYTFLAGPPKHMKPVSIQKGQAVSVRETVNHARGGTNGSAVDSERADDIASGWYIYMGDRINCLEWTPFKHDTTQYLAVSTLDNELLNGRRAKADNADSMDSKNTSFAFIPTAPSPAAIYIWGFKGLDHPGDTSNYTIAEDEVPSLELVLCTDWGPVKQFKWCPVPQPIEKKGSKTEVSLGLLAGIWGDGTVRVVQVKYDKLRKGSADGETQYLYISKSFFQSKPPDTVCSCVAWLSSSDIAVGCANGYVAIWNLESAAQSILLQDPELNLHIMCHPWFYQPLHTTYVSAIYSAYPSRPYLLTTASMDGYVRLTDVRSPTTDHVLSFRTRLGVYSLAWVDAAQAFYAPDETSLVRAFPLRQFYSSLALCRASASVTALAASPVHPFLLIASTDGAVTAVNSLPRIYEGRNPVWQVTWMQHEWRPSLAEMRKKQQGGDQKIGGKDSFWKKLMPDGETIRDNEIEIEHDDGPSNNTTRTPTPTIASAADAIMSGSLASNAGDNQLANGNTIVPADRPLGRITEGFQPIRAGKKQLRDDEGGKSENPSYTPLLVIHETRTAATAVAWNPNLSCGGWAAVGFASGLIRVEDLAV